MPKTSFIRFAALALAWSAACAGAAFAQDPTQTDHPSVKYVDVSAERGILTYRNQDGQGSGVAAADFDGDGDVDIFVPQAKGRGPRLYVNSGEGYFTDEAGSRGLGGTREGRVGLFFDYDNDGDLDLLVANDDDLEPSTFTLYRQDAGQFTDVTAAAGLLKAPVIEAYPLWWGGICAGDINNDGYLDFYTCQFLGPAQLFLNNGDGTFSDISVSSGIAAPDLFCHQPIMFDFNGDGWTDIYQAVDFAPNELWINQHDNTFVDMAAQAGLDNSMNDMGVTLGDYDNDGDFDMYITNIYRDGKHNVLYRNDSVPDTMRCVEVSQAMGNANGGWGWGTTFMDLDRDGNEDIVATNGYYSGSWPVPDTTRVFWNPNGGATPFISEAFCVQMDDTLWGSSLVAADFDRDGDLDILQVAMASPTSSGQLRLMDNQAGFPASENHWLVVKPRIDGPNRYAVGTVVKASAAGKNMMRQISAGTSYLGQEPYEAFFGLGPGILVDVEVDWPDGAVTTLNDQNVDQVITVTRPAVIAPAVSAALEEVTPTHARISWQADGVTGTSVTVQRREGAGPWVSIGDLVTDAAGACTYDDAAVVAGRTYAYRLSFTYNGSPFLLGEIQVVVPARALALAGATPNPSPGGLQVAFALPDASPATLALYDLGGRLLRSVDVGAMGPGGHTVDLGAGLDLESGLYLIRLSQGGRHLTRKAALILRP